MVTSQALHFYRIRIPLQTPFQHAAASRSETDNVVCRVMLSNGVEGFGEGVPRKLVTGETTESCFEHYRTLDKKLLTLRGDNASEWIRELDAVLNEQFKSLDSFKHNAARCAVEMAVLDAIGKSKGKSVSELLTETSFSQRTSKRIHFSMVLGREHLANVDALKKLAGDFKIVHAKIKVGFTRAEDERHLRNVRDTLGSDCQIRLDANQGWSLEEASSFMSFAKQFGVSEIEDPVKFKDFDSHIRELNLLKGATGCSIILDETLRNGIDLSHYLNGSAGDVFSLRLSKCGGFLQSREMAKRIFAAHKEIQIGCQVGETAILSAAGRQFADLVKTPRYVEGSNERFKFSTDKYVSSEDLNYDSSMTCHRMPGHGLGIRVLEERLLKNCTDQMQL